MERRRVASAIRQRLQNASLADFGFAQILELVLMRINAHNVTQGRPIIPPLLSSS
jgi:hypothetical protein